MDKPPRQVVKGVGGLLLVGQVKESPNLFEVAFLNNRLPFTKRTRGNLKACFRGHMASTQRGVGEGFGNQRTTRTGPLYEVFTFAARVEAVTSCLRGDEQHGGVSF